METTTSFNFSKQSKNEMVEIFVRLRGYTTLPEKFIKENELKEMKKYNKKIFMSPEKLNEITKRLYYKPKTMIIKTN